MVPHNVFQIVRCLPRTARLEDSHEGFAIHTGSFRGRRLRRKTRRGAKLSVVCILWTRFRRHELRIRNISTMLGYREFL
jgi:hypothetical protein